MHQIVLRLLFFPCLTTVSAVVAIEWWNPPADFSAQKIFKWSVIAAEADISDRSTCTVVV